MVGEWAAARTRDEAYEALRRARVPAAPVRNLLEVMEDPHMHARGMLHRVEHRDLGPVVLPHSPLRFPETPAPALLSSPHAGEHNRDVYGGLLGLSEQEIAELESEGVI